ncbi:MAG: hypothetical protein H0V73_07475 [Chloroflexi bacterium]|nr:hypothetical protein [Chloroflexota bacterium]
MSVQSAAAAAAAPPSAPAEAEVRELIAARSRKYPRDHKQLEEAIDQVFDVVGYVDLDEEGRHDFGSDYLSDLWADLRPSEVRNLNAMILYAQRESLEACWGIITARIVEVATAFAEAHPDVKRAPAETDREDSRRR